MGDTTDVDDRILDLKHDIRNPLYVVKNLIETHLEFLEERPGNSEDLALVKTKLVLRKCAKHIERVFQTIRRLNEIAHNGRSNGSTSHLKSPVFLQEIVHRVTKALKEGRYLEHLLLVESMTSDLPEVEANLLDLEEIFFNLIVNAAQATIPGGRLTIEAHLQLEPIPAVRISFEDTGHGISEDALPYIFEPFYTSRPDEGGVGFGLYIVKQLVERNRGQIMVTSKANVGTTFALIFPVKVDS